MEWNNDLIIGVEEIDRQHRGLIERINLFRKRWQEGEGEIEKEMGEVLSFLVDYVNYHFITEETIMEREGYPGLYLQRKEHQVLTSGLADILKGLRGQKVYKPEELYFFLSEWLKNHIIRSDMELGSFLRDSSPRSDSKFESSEEFYDFYLSGLRERLSSKYENGHEFLQVYLGNLYASLAIPDLKSFSHVLFSLELLKERNLVESEEELDRVKVRFLKNHSPDSYSGDEKMLTRIREYIYK